MQNQLNDQELQFIKRLVECYKLGYELSEQPEQLILDSYVKKANAAFMQRIIDKLEILILQQ